MAVWWQVPARRFQRRVGALRIPDLWYYIKGTQRTE